MGLKSAIIKTILYAKKNGVKAAYYAAKERLELQKNSVYQFIPVSDETLRKQRQNFEVWAESGDIPLISIVVPCYNTPEKYLRAMIESVQAQSYSKFELILADASSDDNVAGIIAEYTQNDERIKYNHLQFNGGISENTNAALELVTGDYTGLLDHDDVLTPDALYEVAFVIRKTLAEKRLKDVKECPVRLIYTDEDKCDGNQTYYYEPNQKLAFNYDYLLSNNYICHFTVIRTDIIKELKFRKEYDGAQDFDIILRASEGYGEVVHIPKVLYHWRCHDDSTAANPASKKYAYDAGRRAVSDFLLSKNIPAVVTDMQHVGFYRTDYDTDIFDARPDIGVVGGKLINADGRIVGGNYTESGEILYNGLQKGYSGGFLHRAVLQQDTEAVDLRCMKIRLELMGLYRQLLGVDYKDTTNPKVYYGEQGSNARITDKGKKIVKKDTGTIDNELLNELIIADSIAFCKAAREEGYLILWDPQIEKKLK